MLLSSVVKQKEAHTRTPHPPPSWVGLSVKCCLFL